MALFDLPLSELAEYRPSVREPHDFDVFWSETLAEARAAARPPAIARAGTPLSLVEAFDVEFSGFGGDPVAAWLLVPAGASEPLPAIVEFLGYGGGRGAPHERLFWAGAGFAHLVVDTRGQGSAWGTGGATADPHGTGPSAPGFVTRGIESPHGYYYRRLFTDAVRAVDVARSAVPAIDPARIVVAGASQGGALALAAAALADGVAALLCDVPFLSHVERAVSITDREPYHEITRYLSVHRSAVEDVFTTLSYFDGVNLAHRADAPALFSVALRDPICPPSTVFAAFNHYRGAREIEVFPFNEHEGGGAAHWPRQVGFVRATLPA